MRAAQAATLIVTCSLLGAALGGAPNWYACDCGGRPNCMCPSTTHPAADRIPLHDVPQFVLFTHDDAVLGKTDASMRAVCNGRTNPNGCPARATMFTMQYNTDCGLAYRMWKDGYEIADHTVTHPPMDSSMDKETVRYEIAGMRHWAQQSCGIPSKDIVGFRNPYLTTTPTVRQVLHEEGFLYDSTLMETLKDSLSNGPGQRVWPYTMDHGIAQNCGYFAPAQQCNPQNETYPGLWQVPMWPLVENGQETMMDYGADDDYSLYNVLVANFEDTFNGNRAPLPIFIHTPWFTERRLAQLQRFADYSIGKGAYWVTIRQMLDWMHNPVPASQLKLSQAMCGKAPAAPPPPPPGVPLPSSGLNITLIFQDGDQSQLSARKPMLEALVSSLLGSGPSAAAVRQVKYLPSLPSGTAVGRRLLDAAAAAPADAPSAVGLYSGGAMAAGQHEAPGSHLQSGWRLLAGGSEVSFGEQTESTVASFLQYEAASTAGAQHDLSMASMHGGSSRVEAANLAAGMPAGMLPQPLLAGGATAGQQPQQPGLGARPQAGIGGGLPAGQQLPGRPAAVGPVVPTPKQPAGKQQPSVPAGTGGALWQQVGLSGQQPGAAAGGGAALWQADGQLQTGVPAGKAAAGQQAGAGVQPRVPVVPNGAAAAKPAGGQLAGMAAKPAGTQPQPGAPGAPAAKPVVTGELPAPPAATRPAGVQAPPAAAQQPSVMGYLQVTLVAAASDPLAVYNSAALRFRDASFASRLQQMGLQLAAAPELVPFQNGWALLSEQHRSLQHSPPPPAAQPPPPPEAQADAAEEPSSSDDGARSDSSSDITLTPSSSGGATAPASGSSTSSSASGASSGSGGSSGIAGLPVGAFVGVVAAGTVVVAALAVLAAVVLSRRAKAHKAAASKPAASGSTLRQQQQQQQQQQLAGEQTDAKSPRSQQHSIQLEASSHLEEPTHAHMM